MNNKNKSDLTLWDKMTAAKENDDNARLFDNLESSKGQLIEELADHSIIQDELDGRIIKVKPPRIQPVFDYPFVEIDSSTGAGADIEMTLEALPPTSEAARLMIEDGLAPDILPANIVEVIDCVGKNIFIKES